MEVLIGAQRYTNGSDQGFKVYQCHTTSVSVTTAKCHIASVSVTMSVIITAIG